MFDKRVRLNDLRLFKRRGIVLVVLFQLLNLIRWKLGNNTSFAQCCGRVNAHNYLEK